MSDQALSARGKAMQALFNHLSVQHGIIALDSELADIIALCEPLTAGATAVEGLEWIRERLREGATISATDVTGRIMEPDGGGGWVGGLTIRFPHRWNGGAAGKLSEPHTET